MDLATLRQPFGIGERNACEASPEAARVDAQDDTAQTVIVVIFAVKRR